MNPHNGPPLVVPPHIVSRYEQAIEATFRILNSGGNAFDALVGVTVVENVLAPGTVFSCGCTSSLIYHAREQ